ncbi:MAG TPA: DUF1684 domain-containing protein [Candidatus Acidoferrum sp.]|nr:DUF1684 domain-containing protein [Candidatus Acidoferrum sp.]
MRTLPTKRLLTLRTLSSAFALVILLARAAQAQNAGWQQEITSWRSQHALELQKPDGWLTLAGLEWLEPGDNSFGSAKDNKVHLPSSGPGHLGVLRLDGETITLNAPAGGFPAGFLIDGKPVQTQTLHADPAHDKNNPRLTIGTLNMYVIHRGERFALRIKDAKSAALTGFHGLKWYAPNQAYRVTAHWIPYSPQKTFTIATLIGTSYPAQVPGSAEFTLHGKTYRVDPILEDPEVAKLFFVLRDTTSATKTYGACRFLYTGFPDQGLDKPGELVLDFNRLENPPCAYTPYATCPLPPPQNRLPIPLPVGEQRYHE